MRLDRTDPEHVVNFRDVGEFVNEIARRPLLPETRLYRGGSIHYIAGLHVIKNPRTIFNLRRGHDPEFPGVDNLQFPTVTDADTYHTEDPDVQKWLARIMATLARGIRWPLYVHCNSGKDRTGVVVAVLLRILEIPREIIVEEYRLSLGDNVLEGNIETVLAGISEPDAYFSGINLEAIRAALH